MNLQYSKNEDMNNKINYLLKLLGERYYYYLVVMVIEDEFSKEDAIDIMYKYYKK